MAKNNVSELIARVNSLQQEGRYRTALDQILPFLDTNPNDQEALDLAASVLFVALGPGHKYDPAEPITEEYFADTRFDPLFCECEGIRDGQPCRRHWVQNPWLSEALGGIIFDPAGGVCPECNKVFCRECAVDRKAMILRCQDCGTKLRPITKPNGRTPQQTRRRNEKLKLVVMLHEGPVPPTDEYLKEKFRRISPDILSDKPEIKVFPVFPWPSSKDKLRIKAKALLDSQATTFEAAVGDDYLFSDDEGNHFYLIKFYESSGKAGTVGTAELWGTVMHHLGNLFGKKQAKAPQQQTTKKPVGSLVKIRVQCPLCNNMTFAVLPNDGAERDNEPKIKCEHCKKVFKFAVGMPYKPIGYVN